MCVYVCIGMCACMCTCAYICMCVYVRVNVFVCLTDYLSVYVQEMETLLGEHDEENKHHVQELAAELIANSIMAETVQQELNEFNLKSEALEAEVWLFLEFCYERLVMTVWLL